jgi:hypothetical protein
MPEAGVGVVHFPFGPRGSTVSDQPVTPCGGAGENRADSRDDDGRDEKRAPMIVRTVRA